MGAAMTNRIVTGVDKDSHGRITRLCSPSSAWSPRAARDVINDIRTGAHRYFVFTFPRWPFIAHINVVSSSQGETVSTSTDPAGPNHLDQLAACATVPQHVPVRVRKNAADLSEEERTRYVDAVLELRNRFPRNPDGTADIVNWWFKQDQQHVGGGVHTEASFLAWHRELTNRFEVLLQEIDPEISLPYWDWTTDPSATRDGSGRPLDLMNNRFMGARVGDIGDPFTSFYDPAAALTRDTNAQVHPNLRASLPPASVPRKMPAGKSPKEVSNADLDWGDFPGGVPPREVGDPFFPDGVSLLDPAFSGADDASWKIARERLTLAHGWAHRYVGGNVAFYSGHLAFRDPFVFLIHSNLDRLYASWQLRPWGDPRDWNWRLDPARMYGSALTDQSPENVAMRSSLTSKMEPWSGDRGVPPWVGEQAAIYPTDPGVVRPPLYDKYVWDDQISASWVALLTARQMPKGDVVAGVIELGAAPAGTITVVLRLGVGVTWWKGVRVPSSDGSVLIEAEGDTREAEANVATAALIGGEIILHRMEWTFWPFNKAKRVVYRIADLGFLPDASRLVLTWQK